MSRKSIPIIPVMLIILGMSFSTMSTQAQTVGSETYLLGDYLEVGISSCGSYGTLAAPPAGYHPTEIGMGFVADSDQDGWLVGTPNYCGDYFLPGSPVEGFALQFGGTTYTNTNSGTICGVDDITGGVTTYSGGASLVGGWEGSVGGLDISQTTSFPSNALYFVTEITLCNTTGAPINDIYYVRNVDPDNDQPWSFDFTTTNTIVSQGGPGSDALVTAEGLTYGCFLGLGARHPDARVTYGGFFTGIPSDVFYGLPPYIQSGFNTADEAISLAFNFATIAPGECECFAFAYVLDAAFLDDALDATESILVYADTTDISSTLEYTICPGASVDLIIGGGAAYDWTWTPSTGLNVDTGTIVTASPTETTVYTVNGLGGACGDVSRTITVYVDSMPVPVDAGPDLTICEGDSAMLDATATSVSYLWTPAGDMSDPTMEDPWVQPASTTTYNVEVTDAAGCVGDDDVTVTVVTAPIVDAGPGLFLNIDALGFLGASGGVTYSWTPTTGLSNPNIANPSVQTDTTTWYYCTITDADGCWSVDSVLVTILEDATVIIPTGFTPDNDGLNDLFRPIIIGNGTLLDFVIYNRWGELVFDSNVESLDGWDGKYQAVEQEIGTYVVNVRAVIRDQTVMKTGAITLIR